MHILIDIQGYQFEYSHPERKEALFLLIRTLMKNKNNHRLSLLINGMDCIENINAIKKCFKGLLPTQELFIFSAQAPTRYCDATNHARYEAALLNRNVAIAHIKPDVILLTTRPEHGYHDEAIIAATDETSPWLTASVSFDLLTSAADKTFSQGLKAFSKKQQIIYQRAELIFIKKEEAQYRQADDAFWQNATATTISALEAIEKKQVTACDMDTRIHFDAVIQQIGQLNTLDVNDKLGIAWALARNRFKEHQRKLLIDISVLVHHDAKTGIQRVSRSILSELFISGVPGYEISAVYYAPGDCYRYANKFIKKHFAKDNGNDVPVLFSKDDILLVTDLIVHLFPAMNNQLVNLRRAGAHAYFIVYDILPLLYPQWCREDMQQLFPQWLSSIAGHADGLICISASVANEVQHWLANNKTIKVNPNLEISYFHLGADLDASMPTLGMPKDSKVFLNKLNTAPGFLMVGTLEPRKGHAQVLAAFERLWQQGKNYCLFIVGKQGWCVDALCDHIKKHPQYGKHLFWLSDISDEFLEQLYQGACALIFASLGEGFGLPLIEAAQKKLPLIIRDIPVFKEIAEEHAFYFHGEAPENIEQAINEWFVLFAQNKHPKSEGMRWLNWGQSVSMLLQQLPLIEETH
ncbi:MAG: glycosyltransferase family 1 protein [Legionella sp.]|uniref:glycosyltransferase family 4 protein n=1 Tax=Legionella sp. TaxID=459 RepID=UPI0039E2AFDE